MKKMERSKRVVLLWLLRIYNADSQQIIQAFLNKSAGHGIVYAFLFFLSTHLTITASVAHKHFITSSLA
jgi:hypothetical protein